MYTGFAMSYDPRSDVLQDLDFDPKIGSRDIAVAVRDGVVTLSGFVHGFGEKSQAEMDARRVAGVVGPRSGRRRRVQPVRFRGSHSRKSNAGCQLAPLRCALD